MDEQQKRVQRAMANAIDSIYRTHLRNMQKQMHLCAARCCNDQQGNLETVQVCIEGCAKPMIKAQEHLQRELNQFQGRLQNCVLECGDHARRFLPPSPGDSDMSKYKSSFDKCTVGCVDQHLGLVPVMMKSMREVLEKNKLNLAIYTSELILMEINMKLCFYNFIIKGFYMG